MRTLGIALVIGSTIGFFLKLLMVWRQKMMRMLEWNQALEELQIRVIHSPETMPSLLRQILVGTLQEVGDGLFELFETRELATGDEVWRVGLLIEKKKIPKRYYEKLQETGACLFRWSRREVIEGIDEALISLKTITKEEMTYQKKESALYTKVILICGILVWIILA